MNEKNLSVYREPDLGDDFQQIKGIGSSIALALKSLGIHSFQDLAAYTPAQLADRLKGKVSFINSQRIERDDWIGQAQQLANTQPPVESTHAASSNGEDASSSGSEVKESTTGSSWREIADFFVSFGYQVDRQSGERIQTKAHHSQTAQEYVWDGIDLGQLTDWMVRQAKLSLPQNASPHELLEEASHESEPGPEAEQEIQLELADLWISEVAAVTASGQASGRQLRAQSKLNVSGPRAVDLTQEQASFEIEIHLVDSTTNKSYLAASSPDQFIPGVLSYDILKDFRIPPTGRYQFYLFARLLPPWTNLTYLQGPIIQVKS